MDKSIKVEKKSGIVLLTNKDYKAAGGQGVVYCKDGLAYKIYHDPKCMIPEAKIQELSILQSQTNILGPIEPLYNPKDKRVIGFTMPYIDSSEYLCKIFTRNFRDLKSIGFQDIVDMVTGMQQTLEFIHKKGFLVVDYNEMNFLLGSDLRMVFHIDVDSWQTPSFSATALMESVRDRKGPQGRFTEMTDWFSFAVVTFQMYIGIHPYKGFHQKYAPAEWGKRMDQGVSVFDKDVTLPSSCQDFSVIPKKYLEWYKAIFVKGERSVPPYPDAVVVAGAALGKAPSSQGGFVVELIKEFPTLIQKVYFFDNIRYTVTKDGIYKDDVLCMSFIKSMERIPFEMVPVFGEDPLICYLASGYIRFFDMLKNHVNFSAAEAIIGANNCIYFVSNGDLIEGAFERLGNLVYRNKVVSTICPSYRIFSGIIVQDDFMKCHLAIPFAKGLCANIHVTELDDYRIIDAMHEGFVTVIVTEKNGKNHEHILWFEENFSSYKIESKELDYLQAINFIFLPNKVAILAKDNEFIMFNKNQNEKNKNVPINSSSRLYHNGMQVFFTEGNKLYKFVKK
jgi:serine/threonine protein kinase